MLSARGAPAEEWCGVGQGRGARQLGSLSGKQITLTYVEPGTWFGDISLFDGMPRTHDSNAHGETDAAGRAQGRLPASCSRCTPSCTKRCCA
jgi:CRP-like cAMP-binding protein